MGFNPSYAWRSIWSSRSILNLGVRWRVGDGKSINMWRDAWVGGNGIGKLITPVRILDQNATVDALMDVDNHKWRTEVISEVLFPNDMDRILQIPISTNGSPDMRVWAANEDGIFRVRDAYSLALRA